MKSTYITREYDVSSQQWIEAFILMELAKQAPEQDITREVVGFACLCGLLILLAVIGLAW